MLWRINGQTVEQVEQTILADQALLERDLESWIEGNPDILGEPLLIIGRQINVPGINDRLDLLALDPAGNTVIIEVKRGELKDPVDIQSLRYASYISRWPRRRLEELAEAYLGQHTDPETGSTNFDEVFADFIADSEEAGVPSLNAKQRIIIVGHRLQARLGSVALWLLEQGIDIKIVEVAPFKEPSGNGLLISPQIIIPPPSTIDFEVGGGDEPHDPWIVDGESWHLNKRCKAKARELLQTFNRCVSDRFDEVTGPFWTQKSYISFRSGNSIWLFVVTQAHQITIKVPVSPGKWTTEQLADRLGVAVFAKDDSLSEKLAGPTGIRVHRRKGNERLIIRLKDDGLLKSEEFWDVLRETHDDFVKGW